MMYILYYVDDCGDYSTYSFLRVSKDKNKLEIVRNKMIEWSEKDQKAYKKICDERSIAWQEFIQDNLIFWRNNRHAIKNPSRSDGRWVKEKERELNPFWFAPKYDIDFPFCASGCMDSSKRLESKLIEMDNAEIEKIRDTYVGYLSTCTDYSDKQFIDWDLVEGLIPVFIENDDYVNWKHNTIYTERNLLISDIEEI